MEAGSNAGCVRYEDTHLDLVFFFESRIFIQKEDSHEANRVTLCTDLESNHFSFSSINHSSPPPPPPAICWADFPLQMSSTRRRRHAD